jgi:hypothetical protein
VSFNRATPKGVLYFKAPVLKHATNTEFYVYWGNAASDKKNSAAVWSSNFQIIAHCAGDSSSVNGYTATQSSVGTTDTTSNGSPAWSYVKATPSKSVWNNSAISGNTWTLTAWLKSSDTTVNLIPIGLATTYNGLITAAPAGVQTLSHYDGTGRRVLEPPVRDGSWHRIAVVARDAAADSTYGIVDGVRTTTNPVSWTPYSIAANIRFGINITDQSGQAWTGALSEVHIANVERSQAWLVADANNFTSPSTFYAVGAEEICGAAPDIVLPATIYAVVGRAMSIRYNQLLPQIPCNDRLVYSCASDSGTVDAAGFHFTPAGVGNSTVIISVADALNDTTVIDTVTVTAVAPDGGTGTKGALFVGDSVMAKIPGAQPDSTYIPSYNNLYFTADGGANLRFIGSQGETPIFHEGRGGWTWASFTTSQVLNPFWIGGQVDFQSYIADSSLTGPIEYCVVHLGGNDMYGQTAVVDATFLATLTGRVDAFCDAMLSPVTGYPDCKIVLVLPSLGNADTLAWRDNYPDNYYWAELEQNYSIYGKTLRDRYDGGAYHANVSVCAAGVFVDRDADYPPDDYFHPLRAGYIHLADAIYAHLRALISLGASPGSTQPFGIHGSKRGLGLRSADGRLGIRH